MALEDYQRKRKFGQTPEPTTGKAGEVGGCRFVVQKHHATRLHYDFRLEMAGVLKSWAVPKGPTEDPAEKRLAMMVEDHPIDYIHFEGIIPAGNYGAGTVMVWDSGTYQVLGQVLGQAGPLAQLEKGDLKFLLQGRKLKGEFALVRMRSRRPASKGNEWLLLKKKDQHARTGWNIDDYDWSVLTGRSLEQIAREEGLGGETPAKATARQQLTRASPDNAAELRHKKTLAARRTLEKTRRDLSQEADAAEPATLAGAVKAEMPELVRPMLATLAERPDDGPEWLFEIKWDGVRAVVFLENGRVRLQSRNLRDVSRHYPELAGPELAGIASQFRARLAVLDGEIVSLDAEGRPSFERLQQRMNTIPDARRVEQFPVVYYVFDLLYLDGYDLRRVPLEQRKQALERILLPAEDAPVRLSDHHIGEGHALWKAACQKGLEGIVGKRRQSLYVERRSPEWQKVKATRELECVVGGYTEPRRSRRHFGALVLGVYRDGKLIHVGNAGSGFTQASQREVWEKLKPLSIDRNPFAGQPATLEPPHWVRPELVARVKFAEWTAEEKMRAPVVLEVRSLEVRPAANPASSHVRDPAGHVRDPAGELAVPDEPPPSLFSGSQQVQRVSVEGRSFMIQNLGKLFFPEEGYTKRDVVEYYDRIAGYLLPYMQDRPVVMKRYPNGIHKPHFFQKEAGEAMPQWIRTARIPSERGGSESTNFVIANDRATLVYLANLGCIEQNLWMSRLPSLDTPDFVLFDLDPGEQVPFEVVIEVAQALKARLDLLGLAGYPKTSGSRGMHVYVPLAPQYSYDHSRHLAELVSLLVAHDVPDLVTCERSLRRRRKDRVYLDFLQNGWGKTVPPPYSLRARPGAQVSAPLRWEEVRSGLDPSQFHLRSIWERLETQGDLFAETLEKRQRLEPALERLQEALGGATSSARGSRKV